MRMYLAHALIALILLGCSKKNTQPVSLKANQELKDHASIIAKALAWYNAKHLNSRQIIPDKIKWTELRLLRKTDEYRLAIVPVFDSTGYNKQLIIRDSSDVLNGIFTETFVKDFKSSVNVYNSDGSYVMTFHYDAGTYRGKSTLNIRQSETAKAPPIDLPEVVITGDNGQSKPSVPNYGGFPVVYVPHNDPGSGPGGNGSTSVPTGPGGSGNMGSTNDNQKVNQLLAAMESTKDIIQKGKDPNFVLGSKSGYAQIKLSLLGLANYIVTFNWDINGPNNKISNVNANLTGFTAGLADFKQFSAEATELRFVTGLTFVVTGEFSYSIFVGGVGTVYRKGVTLTGTYNANTGEYFLVQTFIK